MAITFSPSERPAQPVQGHEQAPVAARTPLLGISSEPTRLLSMTETSTPESSGIMEKIKMIGSKILSFFQWAPTHIGSFFKSLFFVYSIDKSDLGAIQQRINELEQFKARLGQLGPQNRYQTIERAFNELSEPTKGSFYNFNAMELRMRYGQLNNPNSTLVQEWIDECEIVLRWTRFFGEKLKGVAIQDPPLTIATPEPTATIVETTPEPPPPTHNDADIAQEIVRLNQALDATLGTAYDPPDDLIDPITFLVMSDPVMDSCAAHGAAHYFERQNIEGIFTTAGNRLCPISRETINDLADAPLLQRRVVTWLRQQAAALPTT